MDSNYYCSTCKATMNSEQMWDSHINGKKHLKNVNKDLGRGDGDHSDENSQDAPTADTGDNVYEDKVAKIEESLRNVTDPIVGLDYVVEIHYPDTEIHPSYSCTLCKCTIGVLAVIEHLRSTKHRMCYVEQKDPDGFKILEHMQTSGVPLDGLAEVRVQSLEQQFGRGTVKVKMEKPKFGSISGMKKRQSNPRDDFHPMRNDNYPNRYRSIELNQAQRQFLDQIPFFESMTKIDMLEQLGSLNLDNDDEAKDALNKIVHLVAILHNYKRALRGNKNPKMARSARSMDTIPPPRDTDMGMMSRDSNMGMMPRDSMGMMPRDSMGMPQDSMGMPRDSMGMMPRDSMGMPRDSMGMMPRDSMGMPRDSMGMPRDSMGMMPRDSGMGMMSRDSGMGMPPRDSGMQMPARNPGMQMPARNPGMQMPARNAGMQMPVRNAGMGTPSNIRPTYNELVGYPQPRTPYGGGYKFPYGANRSSYM